MDKDDDSLQQVAHEMEFIAAIRQGVAELDRGDSVSIEEVEAEIPKVGTLCSNAARRELALP